MMYPFIIAAVMAASMPAGATLSAKPLPALRVVGKNLVDPAGKIVPLKGVNLGNWFVLEMWMLGLAGGPTGISDQYEFEGILRDRFGEGEAARLMDLYREHWITDRDMATIAGFGMNVVRLPMNYRMFEDDARPMKLRANAWKWLDRAVAMAEKHGLYTILDMHGVQGGQSVYDHTGRRDQNKLWSEPENQDRLAWLWGEIAKRYGARDSVVAYDVMNEPYGGKPEEIASVFRKALASIRKVDPDTLVYAPGNTSSFAFHGDPKANGWKNVGFTFHYYPGLFGGGPPNLVTHAKHLRFLPSVAEQVDRFDVPFLIGEMNVVFESAGGGAMMRRYFDAHASYGWATTMWSYRVTSDKGGHGGGSWGMVTNKGPARKIDLRRADKSEIEAYFRGFSTEPLVEYADLKTFLTAKAPKLPPLPPIPEPRRTTPHQDAMPGWSATDVGAARKGGLQVRADGSFDLYGGGEDVWSFHDAFRFLHHSQDGPFSLSVVLDSVEAIDTYTKAGLMARASLDAKAACALVSVFPNGEVQFASRATDGGEMVGHGELVELAFPISLTLVRRGGRLTGYAQGKAGVSRKLGELAVPDALKGPIQVGPIALSHDDSQLVKIGYRKLEVRKF
ncbi:MAG: cellulase family glycosylhydrolase [Fimbriimonadaceae bacterium]|nr:cellulase family glycosylhydrolase [Fimbriimonadaceae bacterium]